MKAYVSDIKPFLRICNKSYKTSDYKPMFDKATEMFEKNYNIDFYTLGHRDIHFFHTVYNVLRTIKKPTFKRYVEFLKELGVEVIDNE